MDTKSVSCPCGTPLQKDYAFCPSCGKRVDPDIWTDEPAHVCTAVLEDGTVCNWISPLGHLGKFCSKCGAMLGTESRWQKGELAPTIPTETSQRATQQFLLQSAAVENTAVVETCTDNGHLSDKNREIVENKPTPASEATGHPVNAARQLQPTQNAANDTDNKNLFSPKQAASSDPAIVAIGQQSSNPLCYCDKATMKVSQGITVSPGMEGNVPPIMPTREDDNSIMQELPSLCTDGHGTRKSEGHGHSSLMDYQDVICALPHHFQQDMVLQLAKLLQVPAAEEVAQCSVGEKALLLSTDGPPQVMQRLKSDNVVMENDLCQSIPEQSSHIPEENKIAGVTRDVNGNTDGDKQPNETEVTRAIQSNIGQDDVSTSQTTHYGDHEENKRTLEQHNILQQSKQLGKVHQLSEDHAEKNKGLASVEKITANETEHVGRDGSDVGEDECQKPEQCKQIDKDQKSVGGQPERKTSDKKDATSSIEKIIAKDTENVRRDVGDLDKEQRHSGENLADREQKKTSNEDDCGHDIVADEDTTAGKMKTANTTDGGEKEDEQQNGAEAEGATQSSTGQGVGHSGSSDQTGQKDTLHHPLKIIDKKNTVEKHFVEPKKKGKGKSTTKMPQSHEKITVQFHIVVSHEFHLEKDDKVIVCFDNKWGDGGGWKCKNHELSRERELVDGEWLLTKKLDIPQVHLTESPGLQYKYAILKSGKEVWEFVGKKEPSSEANRSLHVRKDDLKMLKGEAWHQYDCMVKKKAEDSFIKKTAANLWRSSTSKKSDVEIATLAFLPKWEDVCFNTEQAAEDTLRQINQIIYCMGSDKKMTHILADYLKQYIERLGEMKPSKGKELPNDAVERLSTAMAVIYIIDKHNVQLCEDDAKALCIALLLRTPDEDHVCHDFYGVNRNFQNYKPALIKSLLKFLEECITKFSLDSWLLAVPLCHFFHGCSKPYKSVYEQLGANHETAAWWGLQRLKQLVVKFKETTKRKCKDVSVSFLLSRLEPLFPVDQLLQRTLMAAMNVKHIEAMITSMKIAPEVCLANLTFFLKENAIPEIEKMTVYIEPIVLKIQELQTESPNDRQVLEMCARVITKISLGFLHVALWRLSATSCYEALQAVVSAVAASVSTLQNVRCQRNSGQPETKGLLGVVEQSCKDATDCVLHWLSNNLMPSLLDPSAANIKVVDPFELEVWSRLLDIEFGSTQCTDQWRQGLFLQLTSRIDKVRTSERLELYCNTEFNKYNSLLEKQFSECAFEALNDPSTTRVLFDQASTDQGIKIRRLLSHMVIKNWPRDLQTNNLSKEPRNVLKHILSWPSFARCLELAYKSNKYVFDGQSRQTISVAIDGLNTTVEDLMTGEARIGTLKLISAHKDALQEILTVQVNWHQLHHVPEPAGKETSLIDVLMKILAWRRSELLKIENKQKDILNMLGMVTRFKSVDTDDLQQQWSSINDDMPLTQLCAPRQYTPETAVDTGPVTTEVTYFDLSDGVEEIMSTLSSSRISESQLFDKLWTQRGKTVCQKQEPGAEPLSLEVVVTDVWRPVKQRYDDLCARIQNGSVTLQEVDLFLKAYIGRYPDLEHEFQLMCTDDKWIKQRVHQVQQYHELDQCFHGARLIKEAKDVFQLTGDFTLLEVILSAVEDKHSQLCTITDDVVNAKKHLITVTPDRVDSIGILTKCTPLIDWLKENTKDVKELNVLAELAMSSAAGQGDLEVEQVSCLHAAVTGYAPFIYDLPKEADFNHFMKHCSHVWHALDNDPNLPKKLHDTCRHLDWLKNVKESHGSVEVNAISQAKAINARGIYHVGKREGLETESPENVVYLVLMPETKKGEIKTYTFQQLQDLQSKLMLVAGKAEKGKDDVDTFTEVLDGVTRLANIYIKICASGSILFHDWVSSFYCEPGRNVNAVIDFGLSNQMLRGFSEHHPTVALQIHAVCEFFDECYMEWMHYIEVQREQFYNLNHYTTQQVVILCKKIASFCFSDDHNIDPLVYPMLCAVKPNCTKDDLVKAVKSAFKDLAEHEKHAEGGGIVGGDSPSTVATEVSEPEQTDVKERQDFINAMKDADFPEELAKRALHEIPATDIDEGIVWCMDHMGDAFSSEDEGNEDVEDNYDSVSHEDDKRTPIELLNVTKSFESVAGEQLQRLKASKGSLEFKLKELWSSHLQSAATSVTDYLSVEHLGRILEELTDLGEINRPLPQHLVKGSLNLMVCPQADILRAVLSLYLCDGGQDLPLPGSDEVLLCTEHTTAEEVDLLYRRAAKDRQGKIYCLANAGLLDYEVSEKAESYLEKHIKGNQVCRLVVICSKEREDRSRLATALDKHRINTPIISTVKDVQAYLKEHFHMTYVQRDRLHVAAEVDPEHCSVRVVKSERAGVGKSLRIRRLTEELTALNSASLYRNRKSPACVSVTLQQKRADHSDVVRTLVEHTTAPDRPIPRVFHFDIAHETYEGVDNLLFNLLVLGSLTDQTGLVWRKSQMDLYVIETLPLLWHGATTQNLAGPQGEQTEYVHRILALLPSLTCRSPQQSIDALTQQGSPALLFSDWSKHDQLMDEKEFHSAVFQRPFQYLTRFSSGQCLNSVAPQCPEGTPAECLQCLLRYCGIPDPSWAELRHFVWFLNVQLCDSENSNFCSVSVQEDLPGFVRFVVHFMIQMSKDFATRSLDVSEETPGLVVQRADHELPEQDEEEEEEDDQTGQATLVPFQLRRRWETSPHPYLFFNSDHHSMTFLGFYIDMATGNLLDPRTNAILEAQVMPRQLQDALRRNHVQLNENFDVLARAIKIYRLCSVMGIEDIYDPDEEYELTTDNVKKILAIHMRLR